MVLFLNVPVFLMAKINSPSVIPNISANVFASIELTLMVSIFFTGIFNNGARF